MNNSSMFKIYLPFEIHDGHKLGGLPFSCEHNGLKITVTEQGYYYVLEIDNFCSENQAKYFYKQIQKAIMWTQLNYNLGIVRDTGLQQVLFPDVQNKDTYNFFGAEIPVKGPVALIDASRPAIVPSDYHLNRLSMGRPTVSAGKDVKSFMDYFLDSVSRPINKQFLNVEKNRLAFELYNSFYFLNSDYSRFVSLIMVLETLTIAEQKHPVVLTLIEKWKDEVVKLKETYNQDSEEYEALDSILRELLFRKEKSIRSQIRSYVYKTLSSGNIPNAMDLSRKAQKIYDQRSRLLHDGSLPQNELVIAVNEVKEIVEIIFKVLIQTSEV